MLRFVFASGDKLAGEGEAECSNCSRSETAQSNDSRAAHSENSRPHQGETGHPQEEELKGDHTTLILTDDGKPACFSPLFAIWSAVNSFSGV